MGISQSSQAHDAALTASAQAQSSLESLEQLLKSGSQLESAVVHEGKPGQGPLGLKPTEIGDPKQLLDVLREMKAYYAIINMLPSPALIKNALALIGEEGRAHLNEEEGDYRVHCIMSNYDRAAVPPHPDGANHCFVWWAGGEGASSIFSFADQEMPAAKRHGDMVLVHRNR